MARDKETLESRTAQYRRYANAPAANQISALRADVRAAVAAALGGARRAILFGFPDHGNVGDSMIWLAQDRLLRRLGVSVLVPGDDAAGTRRVRALAARPDTAVVLSGGGNIGDLWPREQEIRERVLQLHADSRIVQLPQSLHFTDRGNAERFAALCRRCRSLYLLARDQQSRDRLLALLPGAAVELAPDVSFCLPTAPLHARRRPVVEHLFLLRTDVERHVRQKRSPGQQLPVDWTRETRTPLQLFCRALHAAERGVPALSLLVPASLRAAVYRRCAVIRVRRGVRLLSSASRVTTDRLHAHLLSLLLGIPHALLDNSYGKNLAFVEAWTAGIATVPPARYNEAGIAMTRYLSMKGTRDE